MGVVSPRALEQYLHHRFTRPFTGAQQYKRDANAAGPTG